MNINMAFVAVIILWITLHFEYAQNAEILEKPKTQYVLIGKNATFTCNTIGREAYWVLNEIPITISYPNVKQAYEDQGVIFVEDIFQDYYNLTMIIHTSPALNNTVIFCSAIGSDYTVRMSREVHLIVFYTLRPYQPIVTANIRYYPEKPPTVIAVITGVPPWPGYEASEFWMNITNINDDTLLSHNQINTSISELGNNTIKVRIALPDSIINQCALLRITVSAVSGLYGEGEATNVYTELFKRPGEFLPDGLNLTTFHLPTGGPVLRIQVQLPDVCRNQSINYTFVIGRDEGMGTITLTEGPFFHKGPGLVTHCLNELEKDQNYFIQVQVNSITGSSRSPKRYFDTYSRVTVPQSEGTMDNRITQPQSGTQKNYDSKQNGTTIALGTFLALISLMLVSVSIILVLFCVYHHRGLGQKLYLSSSMMNDHENNFIMMPSPEPAINDIKTIEQHP